MESKLGGGGGGGGGGRGGVGGRKEDKKGLRSWKGGRESTSYS